MTRLPEYPADTGRRREQAEDDLQQRGLAGAIRSQQSDHFTFGDGEVDSLQGRDRRSGQAGQENLGDPLEFDGIHGARQWMVKPLNWGARSPPALSTWRTSPCIRSSIAARKASTSACSPSTSTRTRPSARFSANPDTSYPRASCRAV